MTDDLSSADTGKTLSERRYRFGRELLGPAVADYLMKLYGTVIFGERERGAKTLFVSRAGIRIRRMLDRFIETANLRPYENGEYFWISRLMVAKGVWRVKPEMAIELFQKEFISSTRREFIEAMVRFDDGVAEFDLDDKRHDKIGPGLDEFIKSDDPAAARIRTYFDEQAGLFEKYLEQVLGDHDTAYLVDSGWQGTAQTFLSNAFPDIDWWGAYFGRSGFEQSDRSYWSKMIGLVFEADYFVPEKPQTCIVDHRHMIESLLEPAGSSIERLHTEEDGTIGSPESEAILADAPDRDTNPVHAGVWDYLSTLPDGAGPGVLAKKAGDAWQELSRIVCMPTREDVDLFSEITRSADFGRTLKVDLLMEPKDRNKWDDPGTRINDSLWPAGQAIVEYPSEIAIPVQRRLSGLPRGAFKEKPAARETMVRPLDPARPAVAIITRTLDRPMFLRRALESVHGQTFKDYIQVVVNDGGDAEEAEQVIREADCDHSRVLLVDNVINRGMEAASNIGIKACDSDYIVIHDDDDSWEPSFLEKTVGFLDKKANAKYGGVITKTVYISEKLTPDGIEVCGRMPYQDWIDRVDLMEMAIGNFFAPISFLFRRSVYDVVGGFNENYPVLGDWDFNLKVLMQTDIGVLKERLALYHHRDQGDTRLFGNSVIADSSKHSEYSSIVRNSFARDAIKAGNPAVAQLIGMGMHFGEMRGTVRDVARYTNESRQHLSALDERLTEITSAAPDIDDYWIAFTNATAELNRASRKTPFTDKMSAEDRLATALGLEGDRKSLVPPPNFDEAAYLRENPDVKAAVAKGQFANGYQHFISSGRAEGRRRPTK